MNHGKKQDDFPNQMIESGIKIIKTDPFSAKTDKAPHDETHHDEQPINQGKNHIPGRLVMMAIYKIHYLFRRGSVFGRLYLPSLALLRRRCPKTGGITSVIVLKMNNVDSNLRTVWMVENPGY